MKLNLMAKLKKFLKKPEASGKTSGTSMNKPEVKKATKPNKQMSMGNRDNKASQDLIARKNESMKDSQGKSGFSGSGYNGPGNVDAEKRNSNMGQRNF